jgi:membrane associated rhomboid family serine protease
MRPRQRTRFDFIVDGIGWRVTKVVKVMAIIAIAFHFFRALIHLIVGEFSIAASYAFMGLITALVAALAITVGTLAFKPKDPRG